MWRSKSLGTVRILRQLTKRDGTKGTVDRAIGCTIVHFIDHARQTEIVSWRTVGAQYRGNPCHLA
ncbi:hypothetical protein [Aurantiacibacter marinus]|uniref:hypothetical protein n=1 Tax=Aurantiacibacter marinus TaxID=874156 RepID=UPI001E4DDAED|nr:hypothetical protein [Aurantiacibacter marinus]